MIKFDVFNRFTMKLKFTAEIEIEATASEQRKRGKALEWAYLERVNLEGAYLKGANLEGAYLKGANLEWAYLEGANLEGAYLEGANLERVNLEWAYLKGANLEGANLERVNLEGAYLKGAYLKGANLEGANLEGAYLEGANLEGAYLEGANLEGANLERVNLERVNLEWAYLKGANLEGANLEGAYLEGVKKDFFERLSLARQEARGLLEHLEAGKIDGSCYGGSCACFCGTVANIRHEPYTAMTCGLKPDSSSPTEIWFMNIGKGDTPENSSVAKITAEWIREFIAANPVPTVGEAA